MKQNTKRLLLPLLIVLLFSGCSSSSQENMDSPVATNQQKISIYKDLSSKYKQLFNQNVALKKQIQKLEEEKQNEKNTNEETIKHLSNTIKLLELNLKQMNARLNNNSEQIGQLSVKMTKPVPETALPQESTESSEGNDMDLAGLSGEFKTPDSSKAIKTVPLLSNTNNKSDLSAPSEKDDIQKKTEESSKSEKEQESVFLNLGNKPTWEDPDLNQPTSPIPLKVVPGAKKKYQEAFKTYSSRDFKKAIRLFADFLDRYPSDMDADNSQYWIGQSYYQLEDLINAENSFRKVLRNYEHAETKRGYKTPDSILMLGRIYAKRNQPVKGRYYFEEVIKRFPESRSAAKAKREVQSMSFFQ